MLRENAPVNVREEFLSAQLSVSGPLPISSSFREYDEVLPDIAERILKMAENEHKDRRDWNKAVLDGALKENARPIFGRNPECHICNRCRHPSHVRPRNSCIRFRGGLRSVRNFSLQILAPQVTSCYRLSVIENDHMR